MKDRFIVQKSKQRQNHWVCTDTENKIVCTFENHRFNETQEINLLEDFNPDDYMELARILRELGDYMGEFHSDKVF